MGKQERQRKLARERYERQARRRTERARRVRQWTVISGAGVAVIVLAVVGYILFGTSGNSPAASPTPTTSSTPTPSASGTAPAAQPAGAVSHCSYLSAPPAARSVGTPPATPATKGTYLATVHTNRGNIVIKMTGSQATCTVNSFVYLAGKKYFDNTKCHRLTTSGIYVLQCGDPTGKGTGGPGYRFANEVANDSTTATATYPAGVVAMAHSSQASSNGSQFFLVYATTTLPRDYTPFGTITSGLNVLQDIAKAGVASSAKGTGDGPPKESVIIKSVSIKKT